MARPPHDDDDDIDDDAPWLAEGVRERRGSTMVPRGRLIGGALFALALIVLVGLGIYVISARKQDGSSGFARAEDAPLIAADTGPYKIAPADPGGAAVTGLDDSIAAAGRGDDPGSAIDTAAADEEPLARPGTQVPVAPPQPTNLLPPDATLAQPVITRPAPPVAAIPAAKPAPPKADSRAVRTDAATPDVKSARIDAPRLDTKPKGDTLRPDVKSKLVTAAADPLAPAKVKTDSARLDAPKADTGKGGSATLQLGAFSTEAKADAAWARASAKNGLLGGLTKRIDPVERDGATLYRLRAGGVASKAAAVELCARIKAAGDACLVI